MNLNIDLILNIGLGIATAKYTMELAEIITNYIMNHIYREKKKK